MESSDPVSVVRIFEPADRVFFFTLVYQDVTMILKIKNRFTY